MLRSTFLGYKTATSALKVNQNKMDIVGQNISNINTKGYTRQRLDIVSLSFDTSNLKFSNNGIIIGQGVGAKGLSQFRDSFLDLRYRVESAKLGSEQVQLDGLRDLESILDEISMDKLDAQFSDLLLQLNSLTASPSDPVIEGVVRTSAEMLTQMFNDYSRDMETVYQQQENYLERGALVKVNQLIGNISKLNQQIKDSNISGNPALELNDERNLLIDELSNYLDIQVERVALDIGGNKEIDELIIKLRGSQDTSGKAVEIVNRNYFNELKVEDRDNKITIGITKRDIDGELILDSQGKAEYEDISSEISGGQINGYLKLLNGKGEFAKSADVFENSRGIPYYQNMLDSLANKFATLMNELNEAKFDQDGNELSHPKPLFEARGSNPSDPIRAGNILRMINAFATKEEFTTMDTPPKTLFEGTFQEFMSYTTTKLNLQVADLGISYDTYSETQFHIDYARSSMSSVDLNEEGVNLLQYSKSYNAAARLMTTLDEMLDTLINRMGV